MITDTFWEKRKEKKKKNQNKEGFKGWKVDYSKYQIMLRGKKFPFFLSRFCDWSNN